MSTCRNITASRSYEPQADACLQALITLLKPVNHEGSPTLATLGNDGTTKEASADEPIIRH